MEDDVSRTIRRKNGYDFHRYCVQIDVRRDWKTGEYYYDDPWVERWKYHNDSRWPDMRGRPWLKHYGSKALHTHKRVQEHAYLVALDPDDVEMLNPTPRQLADPWSWD